jgi:APA family basic amino acid/polyamine antiporter
VTSSQPAAGSTRKLSTTLATALVVANMIGTGIFTTSGILVAELGQPAYVFLVWAVGGALALCGAFVYGELGAMMPRVGGEYVYLSRAFNQLVGFLSGWVSLVVGFSAPIAASAMAFGAYLHALHPSFPATAAAVILIAFLTALHMLDVGWGARVQTAVTALKVLLIGGFVVAGILVGTGDWSHLTMAAGTAHKGPGSFASALVLVSYGYAGWNGAAYLAGELEHPARALPRALVGGTLLVIALYLALNAVFFYAASPAELAGTVEVGHVAARRLFGAAVGGTLSLVISLALISSVSAMIMIGPRVYVAMAQDGVFFRALAVRNKRGAPWRSVALQGALATILVLTATFEHLLYYIGFTLSLFAALTVAAAYVLRRREPEAPRPYRAWGWPVTPLFFVAGSVWIASLAIFQRPLESLIGFATVGLGILVYGLWRWRLRRAPRVADQRIK